METQQDRSSQNTLETLAAISDRRQLETFLKALPAGEAARALSQLSEQERARLLATLPPEEAADLIEQIPGVQAADWIGELAPTDAAAILNEMPSNAQADLIGDLEDPQARAILARMRPEEARDARVLSRYPDDVAGGLMVTEYLAYPERYAVADVIDDLRANVETYRDYQVQYAYVVAPSGRLVGVLRLRDLLLARRDQPIAGLMIRQPLAVSDHASLDALRDFFDRHHFLGVPVTEKSGRLVGVVRPAVVKEALAARGDSDYLKSQGIVGGEELRTMPILVRSRRRLAWLSVNIVLNVIAASVIAVYQDTLASVIALAVFLPIISDMSGCMGNQAVAVSMRELTLGLIRPTEAFQVWAKEVFVGLVNGLALGSLIAGVAFLWKGNPYLGLVVGGAMAINSLVAVSIGGTVPLLLKRMKMDPAIASGPILTTITDMCGFFLILSFAAALLPRLVGP